MVASPEPTARVRALNDREPRRDGDFVLYWMIAARRLPSNAGLERAAAWARELDRPLLVLEALGCRYRWAAARHHRFVLQGMRDNAAAAARAGLAYHPWVAREPDDGRGLLAALAARAAVVVTDDTPAFHYPALLDAAGAASPVRIEAVDSNGLLPISLADKAYPTAYAFRRLVQREVRGELERAPAVEPLAGAALRPLKALPAELADRWPAAPAALLEGRPGALAELPLDHGVAPVDLEGGASAARRALRRFVDERLGAYPDRNHPDREAASGLSPWLHFGHLGAHEVFDAVAEAEGWSPDRLADTTAGKREGFWGMGPAAEAFLDELVTWRELSLNTAARLPRYARYDSLPGWAQESLALHASDPRPRRYDLETLEAAETHDPLWNAAQTELRRDGVIHNYMRMLWGKKVLEWSESPEQAFETLVELNNRWAIDGRDANSYAGIAWVFGRYDRPWPERPVFGRVRRMTSDSARRKLRLNEWLARNDPAK